ncbi:MAG: DNA polymerase III subunit [Pseudomonadota bacterium]|nr:DNA polymerase III subunit [Pseudomonadota bacterium]
MGSDLDTDAARRVGQYFAPLLPWQRPHWQRVVQRYPEIAHGLLLSGSAGVGKRLFADRLAAWLLCGQRDLDQACGHCQSCQWLRADTHPNLLRVSREIDSKGKQAKQIKIDQIRALMPFVQQTGEGWRVVIIEPADCLNPAAANALLKTLEEPSPRLLLILVADQALQLPATIRSRVQQLAVGRIAHEQALAYVQDEAQISAAQAAVALNLSGIAPLAALQLLKTEWFLQRSAWLQDWQALRQQQAQPIWLSQQWQKRLALSDWLLLLQVMLRDVMAVYTAQPIRQTDLDFTGIQSRLSLPEVMALYDQVLLLIAGQAQHVQPALVYDSLMQQFAG